MLVGLVRSGLQLNRFSADSVRQWSSRGREAILRQLRENAAVGLRPTGIPEIAALTDAVCHSVDIRRPLGRSGPLDEAAFPIVTGFSARCTVTLSRCCYCSPAGECIPANSPAGAAALSSRL